jgi:hypothetical protein
LVHAYNPSYSRGRDQEDHGSKSALANSLRNPMWKIFHTKKGWGMAQAIECLPSKHKTLSLKPSTVKIKNKNQTKTSSFELPSNCFTAVFLNTFIYNKNYKLDP